MFYCGGNYEARKGSGIGQGSVSLHPGGHSHGPQPGAYERSIGVEFFDELAVMVDTFRPLRLGEGARCQRRRSLRLDVVRTRPRGRMSAADGDPGDPGGFGGFGIDHLPYGVVRLESRHVAVVRYPDRLLDLSTIDAGLFGAGTLDRLLAAGRDTWAQVRAAATRAIEADRSPLLHLADARPVLAWTVADYVDFYASEAHATNAGRIFRPGAEPLPPTGSTCRSATTAAPAPSSCRARRCGARAASSRSTTATGRG